QQHQIVELGVGKLDRSLDQVLPADRAFVRRLEADRRRTAAAILLADGAGVARLLAPRELLLATLDQLLFRHVAAIREAGPDELAAHREHTLELHANRGGGVTRFMPEYSYGLWPDWEVSLQLPLAWSEGVRSEGYRAELQYVAPHDAARGWYWGINFELARVEQVGEPHFWSVEVMPIVGW